MIDLRRVAARYHIPIMDSGHSHCRPGWLQVQCPFCGSGGSHGGWYLGFAISSGTFHCWRCGSVKFWPTLKRLLKTNDDELVRRVVGEFQAHRGPVKQRAGARPLQLKPPRGSGPLLPPHRKYLRSRGYDPDHLAEVWGIGGVNHLGGPWAWRVLAPVHNVNGQVVAYQGRMIVKGDPKYRFTEDELCLQDPDSILYGRDLVPGDAVLVVEGITGCWRIGPGTVATFGIDWKKPQAAALREYKRRYILFDPEPKAQERALELAQALAVFPGETEVLSGFATDPGDMTDQQAADLRKEICLG